MVCILKDQMHVDIVMYQIFVKIAEEEKIKFNVK